MESAVSPINVSTLATLVFALLVGACSKAPRAGADAAAALPTAAAPQSSSALAVYSYRCDSGATIDVYYPSTQTAVIRYQERTHTMNIAISGSGARYTGDGMEWWSKGSGPGAAGTLFRHLRDGSTGDSIETCAQS